MANTPEADCPISVFEQCMFVLEVWAMGVEHGMTSLPQARQSGVQGPILYVDVGDHTSVAQLSGCRHECRGCCEAMHRTFAFSEADWLGVDLATDFFPQAWGEPVQTSLQQELVPIPTIPATPDMCTRELQRQALVD